MGKIFDFYQFINESEGTFKYSFSFPVTKKYQLKDDGYWTYDDVCRYLERNGVNLKQDVSSELGIDERDVTDDNIEEYVSNYGGKRMGGWDRFKSEYGLDFEDNDLSREDYNVLKNDFNSGKLEQYFNKEHYDYKGVTLEVYNLLVIDPQRGGFYGTVNGTFESNRELNGEEIKSIDDYISGQCSDGWGEGFEQQSEVEEIHGLRFDVSLHPWNRENWKVIITKV